MRAIAVILVILHHYLGEFGLGSFHLGYIGVDIFFLISGFLITSILLEQKSSISDKFLIIKNFIFKRALRLFPIYYMTISVFYIAMKLFDLYAWDKDDFFYYYTYTQNFLFYFEGMKGIQLNHLWSLGVEEQFYLFWPWILIFCSNRILIRILLVVIPVTIIAKSIDHSNQIRMLPFYHFDTLGAGALIAVMIKERLNGIVDEISKRKFILLVASVSTLLFSEYCEIPQILISTAVLLLAISLLVGCIKNFEGIAGSIFNIGILKQLGLISYGLYLYHKPISYLVNLVIFKLEIKFHGLVLLFISLVLTYLFAFVSYRYIELYFLKIKSRFDL